MAEGLAWLDEKNSTKREYNRFRLPVSCCQHRHFPPSISSQNLHGWVYVQLNSNRSNGWDERLSKPRYCSSSLPNGRQLLIVRTAGRRVPLVLRRLGGANAEAVGAGGGADEATHVISVVACSPEIRNSVRQWGPQRSFATLYDSLTTSFLHKMNFNRK